MGEFSYTSSDNASSSYGEESFDFSAGYQTFEPAFDPNVSDVPNNAPQQSYGGYQAEVQALIPENVPMLGAILMEQGVLSNEAINQALEAQAETGDSLVQVLLDLGLAASDQIVVALQSRANYR